MIGSKRKTPEISSDPSVIVEHKKEEGDKNKKPKILSTLEKVSPSATWDQLETYLHEDWQTILASELTSASFIALKQFLMECKETLFPPILQVWQSLNSCCPTQVKVVILGQDPYVQKDQAHGFSFSVPKGVTVPPSLENIYQEVKFNYPEFKIPTHGNLEKWAKQGVLLLNSILTVKAGSPGSCQKQGWEQITRAALRHLVKLKTPIVFLLWGKIAQGVKTYLSLQSGTHLILESGHPSPFSSQFFFGKKHFLKANQFLIRKHITPIDWCSL